MLVCPLCRIVLGPNESVCPRDGQTGQEAVLPPLAPALAERFKVVEPFAQGASGTLYLADEPESGRRGLLKVLTPLPAHLQGERQRLRRELVKQATLDSALLVSPFSTGEQEGRLWLFREWVEGVSLKVRIARQGALPTEHALAIAAQLTVALDELHRAGLLHRDLKPSHVLLEPHTEGLTRVRLLDAGVCGPVGDSESSTLVGTPGYIAPEQLAGKLVSFRSDLYTLGCVLYEMLTGSPVFAGGSPLEVLSAQRAGELPELPTDLPSGIAPLLKSLLAKDPQDRPFSAQKVRKTLDAYLPDGAAVTRQPTKTFANVSSPRHAVPREPTGTLRPPPSPPAAPRTAQVTGDKFSAPPSPRGSAPPAPPSSAKAASRDSTQMLELEQILETSPAKPRVSAPPPPPPSTPAGRPSKAPGGLSVPPPPKANAARRDPTEAIDLDEVLIADEPSPKAAEPIPADHTQPIRLEQVLAVAHARARTSAPPAPAPTSADKSAQAAPGGAAQAPAQKATKSEPAPRPGAAAKASSSSLPAPAKAARIASEPPEEATMNVELSELSAVAQAAGPSDASLAQTLELPASRLPAVQPSAATASMVAPPDDPDGDTGGEEATSVAYKPAALAMAAQAAGGTSAEVEARSSTTMSSEDYEDTSPPPAFAFDWRNHPLRRYVPHAAAALVLLGLGGALVSAMGNDDEADKAGAALEKPAEQSAVTAQGTVAAAAPEKPTPSVAPLAAAPKPTVQPLAEEAKEAPKPEPQAAPAEAEPVAQARDESAARPAEPAAAKAASPRAAPQVSRKAPRARAERKPPARATASKSSGIDEKRWAEARDAARAHYAAKRYKQAAQAYEQAARYNPTHPGTFAGLGAARLAAGDAKGAVQAYKTAIKLSPNTSGFHAALGRAYATAGDKTQARAAYKKALALDPKNTAARDALKQLGG